MALPQSSPTDRRYTTNHEWVKPHPTNNNQFLVGITQRLVGALGTIQSVNFQQAQNSDVNATTAVCSVTGLSSTKSVHATMGGILRNEQLYDDPGSIGTDPWNKPLHTVEANNAADYNSLLTAAQYDALPNG